VVGRSLPLGTVRAFLPHPHGVALIAIKCVRADRGQLPKNWATLRLGNAIYTTHCAPCHGKGGGGDGPEGEGLDPSPGNLVWLCDVPEKQWDPFIYWATAEGGTQLGPGMPAYKDLLSKEDIWAVSAYIQANLPFVSMWKFK
jgi:mono/diheme cytochrome c family protein